MANGRLRDALLRRGMTPAELAAEIGVDGKTVERWIVAGRVPYARHRYRVAVVLGSPESYLWPESSELGPPDLVRVFPTRAAIPGELWDRLLTGASERIDVVVYAALFLPEQHPKLSVTLREQARAGVRVRLMLGVPDGRQVAQRGLDEGIGDAISSKIRNVLVYYDPLREESAIDVRLHDTTLYNSLFRFDDQLLVNTHVYGLPAGHAPVLHLRDAAGGELFETYAGSIERIWAGAVPAWPEGAGT